LLYLLHFSSLFLQGDARQATDEDIQLAEANARALGSGMGSTAIIPDSVAFELVQSIGKMTVSEFVEYLDKGILKCVVGSTHSTQPGKYGSRDTARVGREDTQDMFAYDATALASTWKRDVIRAMTLEEFGPAVARKHTPEVSIVIEDRSSPAEKMGIVTQAVSVGMPVDADKVAARVGVPITPKQGEEPRILVPVAPAMPNQVFEQLPEPPQPEVTQQEA
jgi:phage gp29-like protein